VHNIDNSRGSAALHIPACTSAQILNIGFKDIDSNALNQWTSSAAGGELVFTAPANNPLNWNEIFNFWFDSDAVPGAGSVTLDEARVGAGALNLAVAARCRPAWRTSTSPRLRLAGRPRSANGIASVATRRSRCRSAPRRSPA